MLTTNLYCKMMKNMEHFFSNTDQFKDADVVMVSKSYLE